MLQVTPSHACAISSQISFDEWTMAESKLAPSDWLYGFWLNVHYLETLHMTRFGNCVEVMWENPPGFDSKASGFVYLCLPWLNKVEWHAFSLIPHPELPSCSSVCVSALGDWTSQVATELESAGHWKESYRQTLTQQILARS